MELRDWRINLDYWYIKYSDTQTTIGFDTKTWTADKLA